MARRHTDSYETILMKRAGQMQIEMARWRERLESALHHGRSAERRHPRITHDLNYTATRDHNKAQSKASSKKPTAGTHTLGSVQTGGSLIRGIFNRSSGGCAGFFLSVAHTGALDG